MARTAGDETTGEITSATTVALGETRATTKENAMGLRCKVGQILTSRQHGQNRLVDCAMKTDEKQAELEEKSRVLRQSFKTTCVRSMEYYKLADDGVVRERRADK